MAIDPSKQATSFKGSEIEAYLMKQLKIVLLLFLENFSAESILGLKYTHMHEEKYCSAWDKSKPRA